MKRYLSILSVLAMLVSLFGFVPVVNAAVSALGSVPHVNIKNVVEKGKNWVIGAELVGIPENAKIKNVTWKIFINEVDVTADVKKSGGTNVTFILPKDLLQTKFSNEKFFKVKLEFTVNLGISTVQGFGETLVVGDGITKITNVVEKANNWQVTAKLAELPEGAKIIGEWKIFVNGSQTHDLYNVKPNRAMVTFTLPKAQYPNGISKVKVAFDGTVKVGKKDSYLVVQQQVEQTLVDVSIKNVTENAKKWVVEAELVGAAKNAKINGEWKLYVNGAKNPVVENAKKAIKFTLDKKAFPYRITKVKVGFDGTVNGLPVHVYDEKNGSKAPGTDEPAKNLSMHLSFDLINESIPSVQAELVGDAKEVNGTWKVKVNGNEYKTFANHTEKMINVQLPKQFTKVEVEFNGTVDGKPVTLSKEFDFNKIKIDITHQEVEGKDRFTTTINGVEKARGYWFLAYGDEKETIGYAEGVGGATFSHDFENVKSGNYTVAAIFIGTVNDGDFLVLTSEVKFEKKADGSGEIKPPAENPDSKQPPVRDPEETKKQIEEAKKGGKLPKTATTYPIGTVAGLVFLAIGVIGSVALKLRRGHA